MTDDLAPEISSRGTDPRRRGSRSADCLWAKFMGLMGRAGLDPDAGLWLHRLERHPHDVHAFRDRCHLSWQARRRARRGTTRGVRSSRVGTRGPGWCRSSVARTASWSCRSGRSRPVPRSWGIGSRWVPESAMLRPRRGAMLRRRRGAMLRPRRGAMLRAAPWRDASAAPWRDAWRRGAMPWRDAAHASDRDERARANSPDSASASSGDSTVLIRGDLIQERHHGRGARRQRSLNRQ